jgi:hypothetical protein
VDPTCLAPATSSKERLDCIANCTLCWAIDDQGGDYASVFGHQRTTDRCRGRAIHWGEERVVYLNDSGRQQSISLAFTDLCQEDEFRRIAAGRAAFRTADLLDLCRRLDVLLSGQGDGDV